jgi:hypothetical protein
MRASPQLSLFAHEPTIEAGHWIERLSRYFDDPKRHSGFLELAESAVGASAGDPSVLVHAATAALLDRRPDRARVFLKRVSKRYTATPADHLLQALALFQEGKGLVARGLLERHELTDLSAALQVFPAGIERIGWLAGQLDAIMAPDHPSPRKHQPVAAKRKLKPALRPQRASRKTAPPAAPASAEIAAVALQPLPRIDVDISFAAEVDLSPMLQAIARVPERAGRWWELRERFTHLGFAQGFDELLCRT